MRSFVPALLLCAPLGAGACSCPDGTQRRGCDCVEPAQSTPPSREADTDADADTDTDTDTELGDDTSEAPQPDPWSNGLSEADALIWGYSDAEYAGFSTSEVGDLDGDGRAEMLIGATNADEVYADVGRATVLFGAELEAELRLPDVGVQVYGASESDVLGYAVASGGDVDADGVPDVLVGAPGSQVGGRRAGQSLLYSGLQLLEGDDLWPEDAWLSLTGEAAGEYSGAVLDLAPDTDGDGLDDLLIGAYGNDRGGNKAGAVFLVSGSTAAVVEDLLLGDADRVLIGEGEGDYAGSATCGTGDLDGDGLGDLAIGAPDAPGGSGQGRVYLVSGGGVGALSLADADAAIAGDEGAYLGDSVASPGDVDGDGSPDLLVGVPGLDDGAPTAGGAALFLGGSGLAGPLTLADAAIMLLGEQEAALAGMFVGGGQDMDGDGLPELLVGAPSHDSYGEDAGRAYAIMSAELDGGSFDLSDAAGVFTGESSTSFCGWSLAGPGDMDGDGIGDLAVGVPWGGSTERGLVYVVLGR